MDSAKPMFDKLFDYLQPKYLPFIFLLALFLLLPSIFAPFYSDDFFHQLLLRDTALLQRDMAGSIWGLFAFMDDSAANIEQMRNYSVIPWWADSGFYFRFWRPVAELSHALDFHVLGGSAFVAHAHSVLLFCILAYLFYRLTLILPNSYLSNHYGIRFAVLAAIVFLLDGQHVATISWVANRNALIATIFSLLCFMAYIRFEREQNYIQAVVALVSLAIALLSAEAALSICAYLFAYSCFLSSDNSWRRFLKLIPFALLTLAWLLMHQSLGYGAQPSGNAYINPIAHPVTFIARVAERLPVYLFSQLTSSPAGAYWTLGDVIDGFKPLYSVMAVLTLLVVAIFTRAWLWQTPLRRFALTAWVLSAIPACMASPQDRLSMVMSLASAWLFADAILCCYQAQRKKLLSLLLMLYLLVSPMHLVFGASYMHYEARMINHALQTVEQSKQWRGRDVVLLNVPLGYNVMITGVRAYYGLTLPESLLFVGNDQGQLTLSKRPDNRLQIIRNRAWSTGFEAGFRGPGSKAFEVGQVLKHNVADIKIEQLDKQGLPRQISLQFHKPLADVLIYHWQDGSLQLLPILAAEQTL